MLISSIKLKTSKIHERGLFAIKEIKKGTIVWRLSKHKLYHRKEYREFSKRYRKILDKFSNTINENGDFIYVQDISRYMNHSCRPNTEYSVKKRLCKAIRNISIGEEITYDYRFSMEDWEKFKCFCADTHCKNLITGQIHIKK